MSSALRLGPISSAWKVADFTGPNISSAGGALRLRQTASKLNLLPRLAAGFTDRRDQGYVHHSVEAMRAKKPRASQALPKMPVTHLVRADAGGTGCTC